MKGCSYGLRDRSLGRASKDDRGKWTPDPVANSTAAGWPNPRGVDQSSHSGTRASTRPTKHRWVGAVSIPHEWWSYLVVLQYRGTVASVARTPSRPTACLPRQPTLSMAMADARPDRCSSSDTWSARVVAAPVASDEVLRCRRDRHQDTARAPFVTVLGTNVRATWWSSGQDERVGPICNGDIRLRRVSVRSTNRYDIAAAP